MSPDDKLIWGRNLVANNYDDMTLLVLADVLDETGEPEDAERADLIRTQVELEKLIPCSVGNWMQPCCKVHPCSYCAILMREQKIWSSIRLELRYSLQNAGLHDFNIMSIKGLVHIGAHLPDLRRVLPQLGPDLLWIRSVQAFNITPHEREGYVVDSTVYWFQKAITEPNQTCYLDDDLFEKLTGGRREDAFDKETSFGSFRVYRSRKLAYADLSNAILHEARIAANLQG
jgi:uncharacterized protein (TIGR02996 family)